MFEKGQSLTIFRICKKYYKLWFSHHCDQYFPILLERENFFLTFKMD